MGCGSSKSTSKESIIAKNREENKNSSVSIVKQTEDGANISNSQRQIIDPIHYIIKNPGMISQYYTQGVKIGSGSHSFVRVAIHKVTETKRAIKSIEKSKLIENRGRDQFINEINILKIMDHPNIIKLYEVYEDDTYFHLVTEYLEGGELFDYIIKNKKLSEPVVAHFMQQLLSGISYCHDNNVVHRDIKPENLLLSNDGPDGILKIIDFGTSIFFNDSEKLSQKRGNPFYIAPEILGKNGYNEKCDI